MAFWSFSVNEKQKLQEIRFGNVIECSSSRYSFIYFPYFFFDGCHSGNRMRSVQIPLPQPQILAPPGGSPDIPWTSVKSNLSSWSWVWLSAWYSTSGILVSSPNHLEVPEGASAFLSGSPGSRESKPSNPVENLLSTTCTYKLILLIITHNSGCSRTGKHRA